MKILIFAIAVLSLISCTSSEKQIEVVKTDLRNNYSDLEMKEFKFISNEISDREAYNFIYKLYMDDVAGLKSFPDALEQQLKKASQYQNLQGSSKGDLLFHKVTYNKVQVDTIHSGVYILDSRDSIIYRRFFK